LVHFFEVVPPPATAETHVIGWRNWRELALSALSGAARGSNNVEQTLLDSKPSMAERWHNYGLNTNLGVSHPSMRTNFWTGYNAISSRSSAAGRPAKERRAEYASILKLRLLRQSWATAPTLDIVFCCVYPHATATDNFDSTTFGVERSW